MSKTAYQASIWGWQTFKSGVLAITSRVSNWWQGQPSQQHTPLLNQQQTNYSSFTEELTTATARQPNTDVSISIAHEAEPTVIRTFLNDLQSFHHTFHSYYRALLNRAGDSYRNVGLSVIITNGFWYLMNAYGIGNLEFIEHHDGNEFSEFFDLTQQSFTVGVLPIAAFIFFFPILDHVLSETIKAKRENSLTNFKEKLPTEMTDAVKLGAKFYGGAVGWCMGTITMQHSRLIFSALGAGIGSGTAITMTRSILEKIDDIHQLVKYPGDIGVTRKSTGFGIGPGNLYKDYSVHEITSAKHISADENEFTYIEQKKSIITSGIAFSPFMMLRLSESLDGNFRLAVAAFSEGTMWTLISALLSAYSTGSVPADALILGLATSIAFSVAYALKPSIELPNVQQITTINSIHKLAFELIHLSAEQAQIELDRIPLTSKTQYNDSTFTYKTKTKTDTSMPLENAANYLLWKAYTEETTTDHQTKHIARGLAPDNNLKHLMKTDTLSIMAEHLGELGKNSLFIELLQLDKTDNTTQQQATPPPDRVDTGAGLVPLERFHLQKI